MLNNRLQNKRCIEKGCSKRPTFNYQTEIIGIFCFEHKKENMIDVITKRCIEEGCKKIPTFNIPTEIKGIFCFEHKKENIH